MKITPRKIGIIGAGHVGSHAGYALASQGLADEIIYIDTDVAKAEAQVLDIMDATLYLPNRPVIRLGEYEDLDDAQILIICCGPLPEANGDRLDSLGDSVKALKDVTAKLKKTNFNGIIVNITNPADVITYYLQHTLGWDKRKILSTSTTLDSARLKRAISEAINIDQKSISAYALGEHGESQMVSWSNVSIGGKPLSQLAEEYPETYGKLDLDDLANQGRRGGWKVFHGKSCTEFGIGASIAQVCRAILYDENRILPVSVYLDNGVYGQNQGVYASVPAIVGSSGVKEIIHLNLTEDEQKKFDNSCDVMRKNFNLALTL